MSTAIAPTSPPAIATTNAAIATATATAAASTITPTASPTTTAAAAGRVFTGRYDCPPPFRCREAR